VTCCINKMYNYRKRVGKAENNNKKREEGRLEEIR
jgi:hypothetical protein